MALLPRIKDSFADGKLKSNVLFYSATPGMGKTTLSRILAKNTTMSWLEINASRENSVDIIREKILEFSSTLSVFDGDEQFKVIILDECDGFSEQAFKALRGTIEDVRFVDHVRFVMTCNYLNKIPEPIQSRFSCVNMEPINSDEDNWLKGELKKRAQALFAGLKIEIDQISLDEFIEKNHPDMRKIYVKIQDFQQKGIKKIDINTVRQNSYSYLDLWNKIIGEINPVDNYQYIVSNYSGQTDDVLYAMGDEFIQWIRDNKQHLIEKIPAIIVTIADYQAKRLQVIDPVVNLLAAVFSLQKILK